MTDFVISNNLVVLGMSTFTGGMTFDGQTIIDVDNAEAFLVRKDGDAGDVFKVDTIGGRVALPQPEQVSIGSGTFIDNAQLHITGTFIDDYGGGPDSTYRVLIDGNQVGDSTRTNRQVVLAIFGGAITTQNNSETVNNVGGLFVNAPSIIPGTDTINEAFTAKFQNAPTAGTENYVVIIDQSSPGPPDAQLRIGKSQSLGIKLMVAGLGLNNLVQNAQTRLTGLFQPVGAVADFASILHIDARLQGVSGDTNHLTGAHFAADVRTQGVTENIANISQVQIDEPDITDVLIGDITNAQTLLISASPTEGESNFSIRSLGTAPVQFAGSMIAQGASGHAFGAPAINSVFTIDTTSTANGGGTTAFAVNFFPDYTGASGLTGAIALMNLGGNIQTQAVAEAITNVSTLVVADPSISIGAGSSVTNAQSLLISGAPTEGTNNYAQRILGGDFQLANSSAILFRNGSNTLDFTALAVAPTDFLEIGGVGSADFERVNIYSLGRILISPTDDVRFLTDNTTLIDVRSATPNEALFQVTRTQVRAVGQLVSVANLADHSAETQIQTTFVDVATSAGSSVSAAGLIPAGSFLIGVTVRVLVSVGGPASFDVGDGTDVDRWGAAILSTIGTTTDITDFSSGAVTTFPLANDVVITSTGVDFTSGSIRITVHYMTLVTSAA